MSKVKSDFTHAVDRALADSVQEHCQKAKMEIESIQRLLMDMGMYEDIEQLGAAFMIVNETWVKMNQER